MADSITWWLEILQQIFGNEIVGWIVLILSPLIFAYALLWLIKAIIEIVKTTFIPLFYNAEEKRKIRRRQRFADHIESEIRRLNQREDWNDFRFAELEAEIEMEGKHKAFSFLPFINRTSNGLRREESLSKALKQSRERIILIEGDPGSGKSVALRHVALDIARSATKSNSPVSLIPVYLNLKEVKREPTQPVNRRLIEDLILESLKRINDRDVDKFVDDEFQVGLENGSWLFLFDSFDEIPDILGAEDADKIIREYANAIYDFLHGLNACRGVVASRHFKGPGQVSWPRFKIVNLTKLRQIKLVKLSELKPHHEKILLGNLDIANAEIQRFAANPLFLGLLVGYVQSSDDFPQNVDAVFGAYIKHRLNQDKDRVQQRFGLDVEKIQLIAEKIAFCMSQSKDLGLSPTRGEIKKSLLEFEIEVGGYFENSLDALEFVKLARSDNAEISGDRRAYTFSHRRFQEYFATLYVKTKGNVGVDELLTNPRWRETTVVICQTQSEEQVFPIIEAAWRLLDSFWGEIEPEIKSKISNKDKDYPINFPWPEGCLYLLDLLQDGFSNRKYLLPDGFRKSAGAILNIATLLGSLPDRIWALEVAGIAHTDDLLEIIRPAIGDKSHFLSDVAYKQVSRLDDIPDDIKSWIKKSILKKLLRLGIFRGGNIVYAQVSRFVNPKDYISIIRGVQFGHWIDIISSVTISIMLVLAVFAWSDGGKYPALDISLRVFIVFLGLMALTLPSSVYVEDRLDLFYLNRLMYSVIVFSFFVLAVLILGSKFLFLILFCYTLFVMPSVVASVSDIPVDKNIFLVLFSPLFVVRKWLTGILDAWQAAKSTIFTLRFFGVMIGLIIACLMIGSLPFVFRTVLGEEVGDIVLPAILSLGMIFMFYQVSSKILLKDRKYRKAWRIWLKSPLKTVAVEEIIDILPVISMRFAYEFIEILREKNLLKPSKENLYFVRQLICLIENPAIKNEFSESLGEFLYGVGDNELKSKLLDELYQLGEKMKYKLQ